MKYFIQLSSPNEVTGIGSIHIDDPENCTVTNLFLPHQSVLPSYSEFDNGALNAIITDFVGDNPTRVGELCFRWHSHGLGGVCWSGTDEKDISEWRGSWVVNLVSNVAGDLLVRLDIFKPFHQKNIPIDVVIDFPEDEELLAACKDEFAKKVKPIPILQPKGGVANERFFRPEEDF